MLKVIFILLSLSPCVAYVLARLPTTALVVGAVARVFISAHRTSPAPA